ncbi:YbaB/EbfC family nucleoid-associated protein [Saccharopolyspora sp. 6M]|uniref:YbaB/EbfC family nucleoid-associated protein n=1 Tax=Saccharopolyspora sp. 6M TaxID=2877237 RepID=UPI001CD2300E|nr:YbaB/EbfC family nucleoid-associated protein [Saccharopolyspora sp. 6M]MCA1226956.1 YbaB/EbfC family nucleoid-associated protein [Saccharopolyspora sp. 6M]
MSSAQQRVREMLSRFEEQAAAAAQLKDKMSEIRGEARSQDGAVTVTVAPSGAVLDLRLSPEAMRRSHTELQQTIVQTIRQATQRAAETMNATVEPVLGDRAEQFREAYQAHGAQPPADVDAAAEPAPSPAPPAADRPAQPPRSRPNRPLRDDDPGDEDFSRDSFLR